MNTNTTINIFVKPQSKEDKIIELKSNVLVVAVKAPAIENKANKAVVELLAKELNLPKKEINIKVGFKSKYKSVIINNISNSEMATFLQKFLDK